MLALAGMVRTVMRTSRTGSGAGGSAGRASLGATAVVVTGGVGAGGAVTAGAVTTGSRGVVPIVPLASTTTTANTARPAPTGSSQDDDFSRMWAVETPRSTVDAPSRPWPGAPDEFGGTERAAASGASDGRSFSLAAASLIKRDFWSISSPTVERMSAAISRSLTLEPTLATHDSRATRMSSAVWKRSSASLARDFSTIADSSGG